MQNDVNMAHVEFEEGVTAGTAAAAAMIADNSSDDQRHRCEKNGVKALFLRCRANTTQRVPLTGHASAGPLWFSQGKSRINSSFKKLEHVLFVVYCYIVIVNFDCLCP